MAAHGADSSPERELPDALRPSRQWPGAGTDPLPTASGRVTIHFMRNLQPRPRPVARHRDSTPDPLGLVAFYKIYLPRHARELAKREVAARELKINAIFRGFSGGGSTREISVPLDGAIVKRHPQRLRTTFSPQEAETTLGVPDVTRTDFRGGQHLTWMGTAHKLEVSLMPAASIV